MPGIVVVVLEGTCTPAERILIERGEGDVHLEADVREERERL